MGRYSGPRSRRGRGRSGTLARTRADYQREFAASSSPDIATNLVSDILAATTAHLAINLFLAVVGGGIGALVARASGRPDAAATVA